MRFVHQMVVWCVFGILTNGCDRLFAGPLGEAPIATPASSMGQWPDNRLSEMPANSPPEVTPISSDAHHSLVECKAYEIEVSPKRLADIVQNKTRRIVLDPDPGMLERLSPGNQRALVHLVRAARILNEVFLKQDHPDNLRASQFLKVAAEEEAAANSQAVASHALTLFRMFNGLEGLDRYSETSVPLRIFKDKRLHPGKAFYPQDLTKQEMVDYLRTHQAQASALLSNNTVVIRSSRHTLEAVPYSVAFREEMQAAAWELMQAAAETDHPGLKQYLQWQAQALVNDSDPEMGYRSDSAWIHLEDTPLEFTIGRESYYDRFSPEVASDPEIRKMAQAYGIKTKSKDSIGVRVGIVNPESAQVIEEFKKHLAAFSRIMPLMDQYEQDPHRNMTFADVDLVAMTGSYAAARSGVITAQSLPNNDKLAPQLGVGKRMVFHRQVRQSEDPDMRRKILNALVVSSQRGLFDANSNFLFTVGHELSHGLGPRSTRDGRDKKVVLGKYGNILEESKADLGSFLMTDYLVRVGYFSPEQATSIYLTRLVRMLPKRKPSRDEAHRFRSLVQLNFFRENGAIMFDPKGKLQIVPENIPAVASDMLTEVIRLQLEGNISGAEAFVERYGGWHETLAYAAAEQMKLKPKLYRLIEQPLADWLAGEYGDAILARP
jgi:hypothetical protein